MRTIDVIEEEVERPSLVLNMHGEPFLYTKRKNKIGFDLRPRNDNKSDEIQGGRERSPPENG